MGEYADEDFETSCGEMVDQQMADAIANSKVSKPREFWIHDFPKNEVTPWTGNPVAYRKYTNVVDLPGGFWPAKYSIHVLEATPLTKNAQKMYEALKKMFAIVEESKGIYGYHLNGEVSPWSDFDEEIQKAEDALKAVEGK